MGKETRDLGDLSFSPDELRAIEEAERRERDGRRDASTAEHNEVSTTPQPTLWDAIQKIIQR